jgi:DNA segregation ATPase FtsK/SpoIIIE-like protein
MIAKSKPQSVALRLTRSELEWLEAKLQSALDSGETGPDCVLLHNKSKTALRKLAISEPVPKDLLSPTASASPIPLQVQTDYRSQGEDVPLEIKGTKSDPFYEQAKAVVLEARRPSISLVQRRLRIGFNHAARLLESMEGDILGAKIGGAHSFLEGASA